MRVLSLKDARESLHTIFNAKEPVEIKHRVKSKGSMILIDKDLFKEMEESLIDLECQRIKETQKIIKGEDLEKQLAEVLDA